MTGNNRTASAAHPLEIMARAPAVYRPLTVLQMAGGAFLAATAASAVPLAVGAIVAGQGVFRLVAGARNRATGHESIADRLSRKSPALGGMVKMGVGALKMAAAFMLYSAPLAVPGLGFLPVALAAVTALAGAAGLADGIETVWPTPANPLADAMRQKQSPAPVPDTEPAQPGVGGPSLRNVNGVFNGLVTPSDLPVPPPPALPPRITNPAGPSAPSAPSA